MKWIDRQRSPNIVDMRMSVDPLAALINQANMELDGLEAIAAANMGGGNVAPNPQRRRIGPKGSWMNDALKSAQEYSEQYQSPGDVQPEPGGPDDFPYPRPRLRRYTPSGK